MKHHDTAALAAYVCKWVARQPYGWYSRSARDIAAELIRDAAFADVRVAGWLRSPDGVLIARIVESQLPYPARVGAQVLTEAIQIAAKQRTDRERFIALVAGVGATVFVYAMLSNQ